LEVVYRVLRGPRGYRVGGDDNREKKKERSKQAGISNRPMGLMGNKVYAEEEVSVRKGGQKGESVPENGTP